MDRVTDPGGRAGSGSGSPGGARARAIAEPPAHARQCAVAMPDGVLLATDVYLPPAGHGPVLLSRLPYDKAGTECFQPAVADHFTARGYVVVVQDVRGKARSGGDLVPFESEESDGYHTLEWIAGQPWADGPVGMIGDSYLGFTQWAAAASKHPSLVALTPRATSADIGILMDRDGVLLLESAAYWSLETWVDHQLYDYDDLLDWTVRPQSEIVPRVLGGRRTVGLDDWAAGRLPLGGVVPVDGSIPALHLGGFADSVLRGQVATWQRASTGPARQFLVLDDRDHGWTPRRPPGVPYVDPTRDAAGMKHFLADYLAELDPFLDHFVRGIGDYDRPTVRWRVNDGRWRSATSWPPPDTVATTLWAAGGTTMGTLAPADRGSVSWVHDPASPVPSTVHPYYNLVMPADERGLLARQDLAVWSWRPEATVVLAGPARADAEVTLEGPGGHLIATLYDEAPDGSLEWLADGARRLDSGRRQQVSLDLGQVGHALTPGHQLVLILAASAFPRYLLHPGTTDDPWTATDLMPVRYELGTGGPHGLRLQLHQIASQTRRRGT